jgi:hypothetical protein
MDPLSIVVSPASDLCADDAGRGWLVSPATPGRMENTGNSLTLDAGQQWTVFWLRHGREDAEPGRERSASGRAACPAATSR